MGFSTCHLLHQQARLDLITGSVNCSSTLRLLGEIRWMPVVISVSASRCDFPSSLNRPISWVQLLPETCTYKGILCRSNRFFLKLPLIQIFSCEGAKAGCWLSGAEKRCFDPVRGLPWLGWFWLPPCLWTSWIIYESRGMAFIWGHSGSVPTAGSARLSYESHTLVAGRPQDFTWLVSSSLQFHDDSENSENSRARRRDCELPIETFISQASSVCLVITATPLLYTSYCGLWTSAPFPKALFRQREII